MALINRALKLRLYPTKEQEQYLNNCLGSARFLYNQMLNERMEVYNELKDDKEKLKIYKYKSPKDYKKEFPFLKEVDSHSLTWVNMNIKTAYNNFYRGLKNGKTAGFPKFKSKHNHNDSYSSSIFISLNFDKKQIKMLKMPDKHIKYKHSTSPKSWYRTAKLKRITVSKTPSGKYFASCLFEGEQDYTGISKKIENIKGIHISLPKFYVDDNGNSPDYNRNYRKYEKRLALYQKKLSLKAKGSKNREKARIKVARIHEKIANKRKDFIEKLSLKLVLENDCIVLEHLDLKVMSQSLNLGKSVTDLGYYMFVNKLQYKAKWNDKTVILADRWFASSKTCSYCGYMNKDLTLIQQEWKCPGCGALHNRDLNAAVNLRNYGLNIPGATGKFMPADSFDETGKSGCEVA